MSFPDANKIWLTRRFYEDAEITHYENVAKAALTPLAGEVAKARQRLIESRDTLTTNLDSFDSGAFKFMEKKIVEFEKSLDVIVKQMKLLVTRVDSLEKIVSQAKPISLNNLATVQTQVSLDKPAVDNDDDDDGVDLFGSDSDQDDEVAAKVREERLKAYEAKKAKKPVLIAKSNVILDVKPWDDETNMKTLEENVRKIELDGLLWGASKLVPLAYGIHKLQISCVVEDDKVSIDLLTEQLEALEDYVQSVDIAAFNKI